MHSRAIDRRQGNRQEECVQIPEKMPRSGASAPLPPFGALGVTAVIRAASLSCQNAGKTHKFGVHPGNAGSVTNDIYASSTRTELIDGCGRRRAAVTR